MAACAVQAFAESSGPWTCPNCGTEVSGNFCSTCGSRRPDNGPWTCPVCAAENTGNFCSNCGAKKPDAQAQTDAHGTDDRIRLDLNIAFEKNAYFSTYDVMLYIDGDLITVMRHGIDYAGTVYVAPGKHVILFRENSSSYPSEGSAVITVKKPSLFLCEIHAKNDAVQITGERTEVLPAGQAAPGAANYVMVDGDAYFSCRIEAERNKVDMQNDRLFY